MCENVCLRTYSVRVCVQKYVCIRVYKFVYVRSYLLAPIFFFFFRICVCSLHSLSLHFARSTRPVLSYYTNISTHLFYILLSLLCFLIDRFLLDAKNCSMATLSDPLGNLKVVIMSSFVSPPIVGWWSLTAGLSPCLRYKFL